MKIAVIVVRVLLGLLMLYASLAYFLHLMPAAEMSEPAQKFMGGLMAAGYVMPFIKIIELVCAVSLLSGRWAPLAVVILFPVTVNITLFNLLLQPSGAVMGIFVLMANLFLAYAYREKYLPLFAWK